MTVDSENVDVAIVGAGPCGLAAAIAMRQAELRAVIFERACVVSSVACYPTYMTFFSTAEKVAIGGLPFIVSADKPTRRDALAYYRGVVSHFGLAVRQYESVTGIERDGARFVVHSERRSGGLQRTGADAVVIATGYFGTPRMLDVPGEGLPHVTHRYQEGHEAFAREAVVVGGGNSAVDAALDLYRAGARVTIVHFGEELDRNVKPWVLPDIVNRIKDGSIGVRWRSRVAQIDRESIELESARGREVLPAHHVYLMTGYAPESGLLRSLGVVLDPVTGIPAYNVDTMETNVEDVFVAGVLASGYDANKIFIENGRGHGILIARLLAARRSARSLTSAI